MGDISTIDMRRKEGAAVSLSRIVGLMQCSLGRGLHPYQVASLSIRPFGHNRRAKSWVGMVLLFFFWGQLVPIEHKVAWAEAYLHTKWHLDASSCLATIKMRRKMGGLALFWGRAAGSPSSTVWPGPRPTFMLPSAILIHPAVWPQ